jgi:hypothetical protein
MPETDGQDKPKTREGTVSHYWLTAGLAVVLTTLITAGTSIGVAVYTRSGGTIDIGGVTIHKQRPSSSPSPIQTPGVTPSVAPTSEGYTASWSAGLNGWTGGPEWKAVSGLLVSDGTGNGDDTILAPLQPQNADYAIEAQIRLLRKPVALATCYFGIVGRGKDHAGYYAGSTNNSGRYALIVAQQASGFPQLVSQDDDPGIDSHLYRVEFNGNHIAIKIDGNPVLQTSDNQYLDAGKVGLYSYGCPIEVSSFRVTSLQG